MTIVGKIEQLSNMPAPTRLSGVKIGNDSAKVRYLGDVQRLALNPGDTVVLSVDEYLSGEVCKRLIADMSERFPGHKVLVLGRGMKIGVVGPELSIPDCDRD